MLAPVVNAGIDNTLSGATTASAAGVQHAIDMNQAPSARHPAPLAEARRLCESKLSASDVSLYYSVLFLAPAQRAAVAALYAFWLEVREINDECSQPDVARLKLAWWHEEIENTLAGRPRHPIAVALAPAIAAHRLPTSPFFEAIQALVVHADAPPYATFDDLCAYGARARGGVESLIACVVVGTDFVSVPPLARLGAILELATLLRDVGADARRDRVYLPLDDLRRFDVTIDDLRGKHTDTRLRALIAFEAERLLGELDRACALLAQHYGAPALPHAVAGELGKALLRKIRRRAERVPRERLQVPPLQQLWIAWRSARGRRAA